MGDLSTWGTRVRLVPGLVIGAALFGTAWTGAIAWMEWDAVQTIDALEALERVSEPSARAAALDALAARVDAHKPPLGGTPNAWHARARIHLLMAQERALTVRDFVARLDRAEQSAWASLDMRPASHGPWAVIATVDALRDGRLDAAGLDALAHARLSAPYAPEAALWRLRFSAEHWDALPESARAAAIADAEIIWRFQSELLIPPMREVTPAMRRRLLEHIPEIAERL